MEKFFRKNKYFVLSLIVVFFYLLFLGKIFYQRIGAFGCSDQCINFVAAYFMLKGKELYSQIFFNHQILMAVISFVIQKILHPTSLYQLILDHFLFTVAFSFIMDALIIARFRWRGIGFVFLYETSKYYLHGNLFLPEALIVYPFVYLTGVVWEYINRQKISSFDMVLSGFFTWFIIFMREPYIAAALFLYIILLFNKKYFKVKILSISIFSILTVFFVMTISLKDYYFQVFEVNRRAYFEHGGWFVMDMIWEVLKVLFYPVLILINGKWTLLRMELIILSLVFMVAIIILVRLKKIKSVILIIFILATINSRMLPPGTIFFEAFHMLPWYGVYIMAVLSMVGYLTHQLRTKRIGLILISFLFFASSLIFFSPRSFIWDNIDRMAEYNTNYAPYYAYGETIKTLADKNDKLFLDQWDDLIYWQAGLDSSYKYSLYIPVASSIELFNRERLLMFKDNPPVFYYAKCSNGQYYTSLPEFLKNDYVELSKNGAESCLFIHNKKISNIPIDKWEKIKSFGFFLPSAAVL